MNTIMLTIRKFRERTTEEMQVELNERTKQRWFNYWYTDDVRGRDVSRETQTDLLDVCITEEQWEAIRKAVLETF